MYMSLHLNPASASSCWTYRSEEHIDSGDRLDLSVLQRYIMAATVCQANH